MKILLIQPPNNQESMTGLYPSNYKQARSVLPPLGLLSLASYLKTDHDVYVLDMILTNQTEYGIPNILKILKPDIVGVTSVIGLWSSALKIFQSIKQYDPTIHTVAGGPNATYYPQETLSHKCIDFLIVGNGQKPLMELCNQLENGLPCDDIENCYVQDISYSEFPCVYSEDHNINKYPFPDRRFTPYDQYSVPFCPENPTTTMITSMGCPFRCEFCTLTRPPIQFLSVKNIIDEMGDIQELGIKSVLFQDELFTLYKERVKLFCEGLIEKDIHLNWSIKSRIDSIQQPVLFDLMKKAGCFNIHFGIESGNDDTLKRMKKGYACNDVQNTIKMVKDSGLSCTGNFMLAYPGESEKDILQTIDFAKELNLNIAQFSLTIDSPGSLLFKEAVKLGRRDKDYLSEYTLNPNGDLPTELFSASDRFSHDELQSFLSKAYSNTKTLFDI